MRRRDALVDTTLVAYTEAYKEKLFVQWYSSGCPQGERIGMNLPEDEIGRTPTTEVIKKWIRDEKWRDKAEVLNQEVARQIEKRLVEVRVEMLNRQAELGKNLQQKGIDYLEKHEFEKAGEALKAIFGGAELERASRGLPDALLKVAEMKDEDLITIMNSLLNKVSPDEMEKALNFDIDAEFTDAASPIETDAD
jgi:hypothetical protein